MSIPGELEGRGTDALVRDLHFESAASRVPDLLPGASHPTPVTRLDAADRYGMAAAAAAYAFPSGADTVVVASGENWYDALLASSIAGVYDAPILLTMGSTLPPATITAIADLGADSVIVIGDSARVSEAVAQALDALPTVLSVERIGDSTRDRTATRIAERVIAELGTSFDDAFYLVRSDDYWGALAAAPISYATGRPILFLDTTSVPGMFSVPSRSVLNRTTVYLYLCWWGELDMEEMTESLAGSISANLQTHNFVTGPTPYSVAAALAEHATGSVLGLADDGGYPYALAAGSCLGRAGGAVLPTHEDSLPYDTQAFLWSAGSAIQDVVVLGGTFVASQGVVALVEAGVPEPDLEAPTGLLGSPGNELAVLVWDEHPVATSFSVWRATSAGGPFSLLDTTSDCFVVDRGLTNGARYYYRVTANASGGASPPSRTVSLVPSRARATRVAGGDRYGTAVETSRENFYRADTAVLANGEGFADALAAATLCGHYDAPLLLTQKDSVPWAILAELDRLETSDVWIVGGPSVVSYEVEHALRARGYDVRRIGGGDRYDTAARIAQHLWWRLPYNSAVYLVKGSDFPDALSVSPFACYFGVPILLAEPDSVPTKTLQFLHDYDVYEVIIVGGQGAISDATAQSLWGPQGLDRDATIYRVDGANRYETAANLVEAYYSDDYPYTVLGVATGTNFPDALGGGVACGRWGGALLLTDPQTLDRSTQAVLRMCADTVQEVQVYGGPSTVSDSVLTVVDQQLR